MTQSPIEILVIIVDREKTKLVLDLLSKNKIRREAVFMGKGTADSEIGDIFGFGIIDRDVISCFVDKKNIDKVMKIISLKLKLDERHNGIIFTLPINAIGSDLFRDLGFSIGGVVK